MFHNHNNKGQTLVLTLFVVLISLSLTMVFLMPINHQIINLRKITNSYQALSYSESGIEFGNYYAIKGEVLGGFTKITSTSTFSNSLCEYFARKYFATTTFNYTDCVYTQMNLPNLGINLEIYSSIDSSGNVFPYVKILSQGEFKKILRVLDFDFGF